jgi:hypothetical protein
MAICALAGSISAQASASVYAKTAEGGLLEKGTPVNMFSSNLTLTTPGFVGQCAEAEFEGEVVANEGNLEIEFNKSRLEVGGIQTIEELLCGGPSGFEFGFEPISSPWILSFNNTEQQTVDISGEPELAALLYYYSSKPVAHCTWEIQEEGGMFWGEYHVTLVSHTPQEGSNCSSGTFTSEFRMEALGEGLHFSTEP